MVAGARFYFWRTLAQKACVAESPAFSKRRASKPFDAIANTKYRNFHLVLGCEFIHFTHSAQTGKSEIRISKQIRITEIQMTQTY